MSSCLRGNAGGHCLLQRYTLVVLVASVAACGLPSGPSTPTQSTVLSGSMHLNSQSAAGWTTTFQILDLKGSAASGRFVCINWIRPDLCPQFDGALSGTLGSKVALTWSFSSAGSCQLTGTSAPGGGFSGSYSCTFSPGPGVWSAGPVPTGSTAAHIPGPDVHYIRTISLLDASNTSIRWVVALDQLGGPGRVNAIDITGGWLPGESSDNPLVHCDGACIDAQLGSNRLDRYQRYYLTLTAQRPFPNTTSGPYQLFSIVQVQYVDDQWGAATTVATQPTDQWPLDAPR